MAFSVLKKKPSKPPYYSIKVLRLLNFFGGHFFRSSYSS